MHQRITSVSVFFNILTLSWWRLFFSSHPLVSYITSSNFFSITLILKNIQTWVHKNDKILIDNSNNMRLQNLRRQSIQTTIKNVSNLFTVTGKEIVNSIKYICSLLLSKCKFLHEKIHIQKGKIFHNWKVTILSAFCLINTYDLFKD